MRACCFSTTIIRKISPETDVVLFPLLYRGDLALMGRGACQQKMWGHFHQQLQHYAVWYQLDDFDAWHLCYFDIFANTEIFKCVAVLRWIIKIIFFSFHREKEGQKGMMAKRSLTCIATNQNIYEAIFLIHVVTVLSFQGDKGDAGENVSSFEQKMNKTNSVRNLRLHL